MKFFVEPDLEIEKFELIDVIASSVDAPQYEFGEEEYDYDYASDITL